jgi:hypothetical protein
MSAVELNISRRLSNDIEINVGPTNGKSLVFGESGTSFIYPKVQQLLERIVSAARITTPLKHMLEISCTILERNPRFSMILFFVGRWTSSATAKWCQVLLERAVEE